MAITTERSWGAAAWLVVALAMGVHSACSGRVTFDTGGTGGGGSGPTGGGTGGTGGKNTSVTTTSVGPSTSVTTSSITTSVGPTTTTSGGPVNLAAECASDFDCGGNGHCVTPQDNDPLFGGGAPGGYCTHKCTTDAECEGPASTCLKSPDGSAGECVLGCVFGVPDLMYLNDPLDPEKCRGREDLRCQQIADGSQICLPTCGSDAQCPGRHCDPRISVCVDATPMGDPLGAKCDPMAMTTTCAGICIALADGKSMCTSACTMGGEVPNENECGGSGSGVCLFSPQGTGVGDLGFCAQACNAQDHCQTPDFFCFDIGLGDIGSCLNSESCSKDSDCKNLPSASCVATKLGSFCMSSKYPLASLAP